MKKRLRLLGSVILLLLVVGAWVWRYVTMNRYYDELSNSDYQLYQMGELVPYEDDGTDFYTDMNGYYVQAEAFEIRDYHEYVQKMGLTINDPYAPQKLALISLTFKNEGCDGGLISLPALYLRNIDTVSVLDWNVAVAANPILQGNLDFSLKKGSTCQVVVPFGLMEQQYTKYSWDNLDNSEFYLQVTNLLTKKEIQVNG